MIDAIHMIPQLAAAICTVEIICQQMLWTVFYLWRSAFCLSDTLLHLLPDLPLDDGFVDILEHCPVLFRIRNAGLVLEGLGIGFEIHNIPTVLLLPQDLFNGRLAPFLRIGLRYFAASGKSLFPPIGHGNQDFSSL